MMYAYYPMQGPHPGGRGTAPAVRMASQSPLALLSFSTSLDAAATYNSTPFANFFPYYNNETSMYLGHIYLFQSSRLLLERTARPERYTLRIDAAFARSPTRLFTQETMYALFIRIFFASNSRTLVITFTSLGLLIHG